MRGGRAFSGGGRKPIQMAILGSPRRPDVAKRASVLRLVAEGQDLQNGRSPRTRAFVLMQYFWIYEKKSQTTHPNLGLNFDGYNFWLGKLNEFNGNFVNAEHGPKLSSVPLSTGKDFRAVGTERVENGEGGKGKVLGFKFQVSSFQVGYHANLKLET